MNVHVNKPVPISISQVASAYRKVRRGGKSTGVDEESWTDFDQKLEDNLYVIWNRLASGTYHPQAVREVLIPKKDGSKRKLGIPTLRDRIAQQVVKDYMEKRIDRMFHEQSYGYRPMKSAHQALAQVRKNCYSYNWVVDLDIHKFFDEIDHEKMLLAVSHVMSEKWVLMYVKRWLEMPIQQKGRESLQRREGGTPQGGVISPLLANLFLHFAFDQWLSKHYPQVSFVRYADDIIVHCSSKTESEEVLEAIRKRMQEVNLQVKEEKTHIAYCKDYRRKDSHEQVKFEFLGFSFRPRPRTSKEGGKSFMAFTAEISTSNQKKIREEIGGNKVWRNTKIDITDIATTLNTKLRGWINYYGLYSKRNLRKALSKVDEKLVKWYIKKHKTSQRKARVTLKRWKQEQPKLFYHWEVGYG